MDFEHPHPNGQAAPNLRAELEHDAFGVRPAWQTEGDGSSVERDWSDSRSMAFRVSADGCVHQ